MAITFEQIPIDIFVPGQYVEVSNTQAIRGVVGIPSVVLMFGQRLSTGAAPALTPVQLPSADDAEAAGLFGLGSQLHRMVRAFKRNNRWTELWAIPLDDLPAGVKAIGSYTFGGSVSAAGTLSLLVAGTRVRVGVAITDAAAYVATAVANAINAQTDLPVTAAVDGTDTAKVKLTARHTGECGNDIDLRYNYYDGEQLPAGLTVTVTAMTGGTGNPDLATAIAKMADVWYSDIVTPYTDTANLDALAVELEDRFSGTRQMDGFAYAAKAGTHGAISSFGTGRNDKTIATAESSKRPICPPERAAMIAAQCAFALKQHPGRPMQTLPLVGDLPPAPADRFDMTERDLLLHAGISTSLVDAGGTVRIERVVTGYRLNAYGITDRSYLDVMTMRQIAVTRYHFRAWYAQAYPRALLAEDGNDFGGGQEICTPGSARGIGVAAYAELIEAAICQDMPTFKADSLWEIDQSDRNRLNALLAVTFTGALIVFAAKLQFRS